MALVNSGEGGSDGQTPKPYNLNFPYSYTANQPTPTTVTLPDGRTYNINDPQLRGTILGYPSGRPTGPGANLLDFGSVGGGGGGSGVDHFGDVSGDTAATIAEQKRQFDITNQFNNAQFNWKKAQDDRDYALAVGDQDLARQKQADANYWQGQTIAAQERMNSQDNQTSIATHQIDAQAQMQAASIGAAAQRYQADLRFQADMAGAQNDVERNRIMLAHEQEYAQIAKMEDDTKRSIAAQENNIKAFDAESTRAYQMGDLALKNNQFLLDKATSPRDLFGLFFAQRGISPDWQTMLNGGTPAQGQALAPVNPMTAYIPNVTLPQDFTLNPGQSYNGVGSFTKNMTIGNNPFITSSPNSANGGGGGGGASFAAGGMGGGFNMPDFGAVPASSYAPPQLTRTPTDINPGGYLGGIPAAGLRPGMNLSTVGSPILGSDINMGTAYYDQGKTNAVKPGDTIDKGTQLWIDYGGAPSGNLSGDQIQNGVRMATGGFTNAPKMMVGDAPTANPFDGGARPEMIENPTGAPIRVKNTAQTAADFGMMPTADTAQTNTDFNIEQLIQMMRIQNLMKMRAVATGQTQPPMQQSPAQLLAGMQQPMAQPPMPGAGANLGPMGPNPNQQFAMSQNQGIPPAMLQQAAAQLRQQPPRFALGTDVSAQYQNTGMGDLYQQSSSNPYLQGKELPPAIKMLADYGVPISPSLYSASSGGVAPNLNVAGAFNQRGGGALPSLQSFNNMTKSEADNFQGYAQGVVGVPWSDIVDFLGRPTQNLMTSRRSMGGI